MIPERRYHKIASGRIGLKDYARLDDERTYRLPSSGRYAHLTDEEVAARLSRRGRT